MSKRPTVHHLELRVVEVAELFNSMDPTPFLHRDLDRDAEQFLESWALEFPQDSRFRIVVHVERMPAADPAPLVSEAIRNYFEYRATVTRRKLRALLGEGRASLVIGLAVLGLCLLGADLLSANTASTLVQLSKEGLLIGGGVAMWRPMQIFLYEWWPIARRCRIYRNLARSTVQVVPAKPSAGRGSV